MFHQHKKPLMLPSESYSPSNPSSWRLLACLPSLYVCHSVSHSAHPGDPSTWGVSIVSDFWPPLLQRGFLEACPAWRVQISANGCSVLPDIMRGGLQARSATGQPGMQEVCLLKTFLASISLSPFPQSVQSSLAPHLFFPSFPAVSGS